MAKFSHDAIVIGGGAGGLTAAVGLSQLGMKTALIDKERLGGDCLHYGCVPSKTLLKTASVYHQMQHADRFGLPPAKTAPVDMGEVNKRIASVIDEIQEEDSPERFTKLGAEVLFGNAQFVSPHEIELDGDNRISAKKIVVATGSSPRALPIPGLDEAGFITNVDAFSLPKLPKRLVTIGGGPIGVELSQAFRRLGAEVTIIDIAMHVLPREDEDMAAIVQDRLVEDGIRLELGVKIERVEKNGATKRVILTEDDGREVTLEADEILMAVGRQGNTDGLGLEQAGVKVEKSFITVNEKLESSQSHILGVGDVNGKFLFTHVAGAEGSVAVRRIGLHIGGKMNYQNVPWCTYTDPELASVGYNELRATQEGISYHTIVKSFDETDRSKAEGERRGKLKILLDKKDRVIGTQLVGFHAGELITPHLFAVGERWKASKIMSPIFPYPNMSELHKKGVSSYMAPKLFNDKVRGVLRFLFGHRGDGGEGYQ
jgi:pyruvate/2-oxoglutarate dehydrogenase complex dihydrolipoamide dehydrogenase (E3) component